MILTNIKKILKTNLTDEFALKKDAEAARLGLTVVTHNDQDAEVIPISAQEPLPSAENPKGGETPSPAAPPPPPPAFVPTLCSLAIIPNLNATERDFINSPENSERYKQYRFSEPYGNMYVGTPFNDSPFLLAETQAANFPTRIEIDVTKEGLLHRFKLAYGTGFESSHPRADITYEPGNFQLRQALGPTARIVKLRMEKRMRWAAVWLRDGESKKIVVYAAGATSVGDEGILDYDVPGGCSGLKGFWGRDGAKLERIGCIWG